LTAALREATGLEVVVGIVDDEAAVKTVLCAAPQDTIALLSPLAVGQASLDCNSQMLAVGVGNNGLAWDAGMIVVGRGSGLAELTDLEGKIWAVGDQTSLPNYLYVQALLADLGITLAETRFFPGDNTALLAVFNGEADFATASYLPPILPFSEREWVYGEDDPELWRRLGIPPTRSGQGFVIVNGSPEFGGYRVRDARAGIFDTTPEIFTATEIMTLTAPLPLDTFVVGAQFPLGLARQVEAALITFGGSEACADSLCAADFLNWAGIIPAADENYDPLRLIVRYNGPQTDQE
jgi:ABC-type phosphate/phosphonate transport system substrate-binding protein